MATFSRQNQPNPPLPKKKRVDKVGNDRRKLYIKSGKTTTVLCEQITENAAKDIFNTLEERCKAHKVKLEVSMKWAF